MSKKRYKKPKIKKHPKKLYKKPSVDKVPEKDSLLARGLWFLLGKRNGENNE